MRSVHSNSRLGLAVFFLAACAKAGAGQDDTVGENSSATDPFDSSASLGSSSSASVTHASSSGGLGGDPHGSGVSSTVTAGSGGGLSSVSATASGTSTVGVGTSGSAGQGGASPAGCDHDVCTSGGPLKATCDACSKSVCAGDPFCCDTSWDNVCVSETATFCAGDPCGVAGTSSSATSSASAGGGGGVLTGNLLITEIMNDPATVEDAKGEWFEVHNMTASPIELKGLVLRHQFKAVDAKAIELVTSSLVIPAGGYVVLGNNGNVATNGAIKVDYVYSAKLTLNNTKDYLAIETNENPATVIDEVAYDAAKLKVTGKSRNLDPKWLTTLGNDDDTHFCAATSLIVKSVDYGTPGKANDACK